MKNLKLTLVAFLMCFYAQAQISTPIASPEGSVYSKVGLTDVTIEYYRPKVKGRKIFGSDDKALLQYGELWRTGANYGSRLIISTNATIGGTEVEAGEYLILTIPGKNEWTFILYKDTGIGGNMNDYEEKNAVVKTTVNPEILDKEVGTLTFNIADISEDNTSANIQLTWSNVSIKVPLEVSFEEIVMKEIEAKTTVNPSNYIQAARFYYDYDKDLNQALKWVDLYFANGNNSTQFWHVHLKAQILAKLGKKEEAIETAEKSLELAKNNPNGDFGYVKRNKDLIASLK